MNRVEESLLSFAGSTASCAEFEIPASQLMDFLAKVILNAPPLDPIIRAEHEKLTGKAWPHGFSGKAVPHGTVFSR